MELCEIGRNFPAIAGNFSTIYYPDFPSGKNHAAGR